MSASAEKARAQRLQRLQTSLDVYLELPEAAAETLMSELQLGELHPEAWEKLHAAAVRDSKEFELEIVYGKITVERRLKQLTEEQRISVLLHAADFFQGVLGYWDVAESYLSRILEVIPDHADAFARLERRFSESKASTRLVELYARVAGRPSKPPGPLATAVVNIVSRLPSTSPVSDEACRKLLVLLPESPSLLGVLEGHSRNTGRFDLACSLLEESIERFPGTAAETLEKRRQLIKLYLGDANAPAKAIAHVEALLIHDPSDAQARAAADRLLREPQVASRAAAALQEARRTARERGL
jgi:tetratricopeptide (TPR) repeat protein